MSLWKEKKIDGIIVLENKCKLRKSQIRLQLNGKYRAWQYIDNRFISSAEYGPDDYLNTVQEIEDSFLAGAVIDG